MNNKPMVTRFYDEVSGEMSTCLTQEVANAIHRGGLAGTVAAVNIDNKRTISFWVKGKKVGTLPRKYLVE